MKPQVLGAQRGAFAPSLCGSKAVRSIQEELVVAIQGALEVAVEIAARKVKALVGQATSDMYEDLRRENESLKERLQRAEQMLAESERAEEDSGCVEAPHLASCAQSASLGRTEVRGEPAGHCHPGPDWREYVNRHEEMRAVSLSGGVKEHHKDVTEIPSQKIAEGVISTTCLNSQVQESAPPVSSAIESTMEHVIKEEEPEEERGGASRDLVLIKEENVSMEGIKWPPEVIDIQTQDPNAHVPDATVDQDFPLNMGSSFPPTSDPPFVPQDLPDMYHLAENDSVSRAPARLRGHGISSIPTCKFCCQSFAVPSLLRRHYGQCLQRLQQLHQPSASGGGRTRLQIYPPGCSPFRCTVCNREFNRLENLKTHLRIHTGERPFTCSVCLKCFRHSGALTRHFRIHTGEKPYICGQCGKSFRNCGGLKFHQRSHNKQLQ